MRRISRGELSAEWQSLLLAAEAARARAYAPYSRFPVGAALKSVSGEVFTGCNVENASYGLAMCAERVALFSAVASGARDLDRMAVVTASGAMPCGGCRQALAEFAPRLTLLVADDSGQVWLACLDELLPCAFSAKDLPGEGNASSRSAMCDEESSHDK